MIECILEDEEARHKAMKDVRLSIIPYRCPRESFIKHSDV